MRVDPIELADQPPERATLALAAPTGPEPAMPTTTPVDRALQLLGEAADEFDRALELPALVAARVLAGANVLLVGALEALMRARADLHPAAVDHATHALAAGGDARELLHDLIDRGVAGDPDARRTIAGAIEQALAYARMAIATAIGEP